MDLDALMRALDVAAGEPVPPPLPTAPRQAAPASPVEAFPDRNADIHFDRKHEDPPKPPAPRPARATPRPAASPAAPSIGTRLHDPAALRDAVVLQTILERRTPGRR